MSPPAWILLNVPHLEYPPSTSPDGVSLEIHPPALQLRTPALDGPCYRELTPDHPLYQTAAWAWHADHRRELRGESRRGLYRSLQEAWPTTRGVKKEREHRSLQALRAHDAGASIDTIAREFGYAPDTVRRWIHRARKDFGAGCDFEIHIALVWSDQPPADPSRPSPLELAQAMARSPAQLSRMEDDRRCAERAASLSTSLMRP